MASNQVSYVVSITNRFSSLAIEHNYSSEEGSSLGFASKLAEENSAACSGAVDKPQRSHHRRKSSLHLDRDADADGVYYGSHAIVDSQTSDIALDSPAPRASSSIPSNFEITSPVVDSEVPISFLPPVSSDVSMLCDPPDCQKDLVCFVFNNLSPCNLSAMVAEFSESVSWAHLPWVAKYLVQRASIEPNLHTLYMDFLDGLGELPLSRLVLKETYI